MATPTIASFTGTTTFTFATGCSWAATCTFTNVNLRRNDKDALIGTYTCQSNGTVTQLWDETAGTLTVIQGDNASVVTPTGFNIHENEFTAELIVDPVIWTTFDNRYELSEPGNARLNATIVAVIEFDSSNTAPVIAA